MTPLPQITVLLRVVSETFVHEVHMRRIAATLTGAGVVLWVLGVAAWMMGVWATLGPDAARVLVLTLVGLGGGVLLVIGALVARAARRGESSSRSRVGPRGP